MVRDAAAGAVGTVGKPERFLRRLFQAAVEIIKQKSPKATFIDFHSCGSFHSALRRAFFWSLEWKTVRKQPSLGSAARAIVVYRRF
jgi:hypothetical protein